MFFAALTSASKMLPQAVQTIPGVLPAFHAEQLLNRGTSRRQDDRWATDRVSTASCAPFMQPHNRVGEHDDKSGMATTSH
jgi:hypothetical protein